MMFVEISSEEMFSAVPQWLSYLSLINSIIIILIFWNFNNNNNINIFKNPNKDNIILLSHDFFP